MPSPRQPRVVPLERVRIDDFGRPVHALGLAARVRVGQRALAVQPVAVAACRRRAPGTSPDHTPSACGVERQTCSPSLVELDLDAPRRGRPYA